MRTDRLRALIERMQAEGPRRFDMARIFTGPEGIAIPTGHEARAMRHCCGTAACIAGWAGVVAHPLGGRLRSVVETVGVQHPITGWTICDAAGWLGIENRHAFELCAPPGYYLRSTGYTHARALAVLEHMLAVYEADGRVSVRWDLFDARGCRVGADEGVK